MRAIRWGIFGTGRMASVIAEELQRLAPQGSQLWAVASRNRDTASAFASRYGAPHAYGAYSELVSNTDVDIVYVATPPSEHASHMMLCLESGKSVLCEKPFTLNAQQARAVIDTARGRKLFLMEALWTRFLPAVAALRDLASTQAIGKIQLIVAGGAFVPDCPPTYYLLAPDLGGGVLLDAGVYLVSLSSMLLGAPSNIQASLEIGSRGVDEQDALILDHDSGAKSLLYVSMRARRAPDMEVLGTGGRILLGAPIFKPTRLTLSVGSNPPEVRDFPIEGSGYGYQLLAAADALRNGRTECGVMPLSETLSILESMDEARRQNGFRYPGEDNSTSAVA